MRLCALFAFVGSCHYCHVIILAHKSSHTILNWEKKALVMPKVVVYIGKVFGVFMLLMLFPVFLVEITILVFFFFVRKNNSCL